MDQKSRQSQWCIPGGKETFVMGAHAEATVELSQTVVYAPKMCTTVDRCCNRGVLIKRKCSSISLQRYSTRFATTATLEHLLCCSSLVYLQSTSFHVFFCRRQLRTRVVGSNRTDRCSSVAIAVSYRAICRYIHKHVQGILHGVYNERLIEKRKILNINFLHACARIVRACASIQIYLNYRCLLM